MGFQPDVNTALILNGRKYTIGEHPNAPSIPYGQEGRQGVVYLLHAEDRRRKKALKVFRGKFVNPSLVYQTQQISKYAKVEGLLACDRFIVTPQDNKDLLSVEPDLLYAIAMAWIEGPTWMDILLGRQKLTRKQSHNAAYSLAQSLVAMEQRGLAHGDLSAPNVMLPMFGDQAAQVKPVDYVQLVDLEQMYASHLERPEHLPTGSPGYGSTQHPLSAQWGPHADRFAGAVLLMEMLGASSSDFFDAAHGESYFAPDELQTASGRFDRLVEAIRSEWGQAVSSLCMRAWDSRDLTQCPTFGEWLIELAKLEAGAARSGDTPAILTASKQREEAAAADSKGTEAHPADRMLDRAKRYESKGKYAEAMDLYRTILRQDPHASLAKEIEIAIADLEEKLEARLGNKREQSKRRLRSLRKTTVAALLVVLLGTGGYYAYNFLKDFDFGGKQRTATESVADLKLKIQSLEGEVSDKQKTIEDLTARMEQLGKPMEQRNEDMLMQLSQDFEQIRKAAQLAPDKRTDPSQLTYDAAQTFMEHWYAYLSDSYLLDGYFVEQLKLVEGYYYPFLYNHNRNAQLNIRFFNDYKNQLTGEGLP